MPAITLNINYDLPKESWEKISLIYQSMQGWQGYDEGGIPLWTVDSQKGISLYASVEPSGLVLEYTEADPKVENWIANFIFKASAALGYTVKDAEA